MTRDRIAKRAALSRKRGKVGEYLILDLLAREARTIRFGKVVDTPAEFEKNWPSLGKGGCS